MTKGRFLLFVLFAVLVACSSFASPIPQAVYYLRGRDASSQVWRLDLDGGGAEQITEEESGAEQFSVSPADGTLAILSDNQLFLVDPEGGERRLIADARHVYPNSEDYAFRGLISDPVFSPDGAMLAYAFDGVHLYELASGEDQHVLTNLGNLLGETFVFTKETYAPGSWSPDGSKLLIIMGYFEGSTLAVMDPDAKQPYTRLRSNGPVCCTFVWSADSQAVLVANPYYTGDIPGLWRYAAATGEEELLVTGVDEKGTSHFVGWPFQFKNGTLYYFHAAIEQFSPEEGIPLSLVRHTDVGSFAPVQPETFTNYEVLWAIDGSFALAVGPGESGWRLQQVPTDGSRPRVLIEEERIRDLAWGP